MTLEMPLVPIGLPLIKQSLKPHVSGFVEAEIVSPKAAIVVVEAYD